MALSSYFESEALQRSALAAVGDHWFVGSELDLYDQSFRAFDPGAKPDEALTHFRIIYCELAGQWQIFRTSRPGPCWQPEQVFETIKREFSDLSWKGQVNLLNFPKTAQRLESRLAKMRGIKPNKGFPHMTVSKFLHFYNPALFPIYDEAMIWNKVFKRFDMDFYSFCWNAGIDYHRAKNDDTTAFLRYYMLWANSLMSKAHPRFMGAFKDWLHSKPGTRLEDRSFDPTTLYARAFEYTAVGAANLKGG